MTNVIPPPTGPYYVGCSDVITDYGQDRILFRMFYPAKRTPEVKDAIWLTDSEHADGFVDFSGVPYLSWLFKCLYSSATIPAGLNAEPVVPDDVDKFPIVVFSHGLGGDRTSYTNICTQLASYGMLVFALEHADQSASATHYYEKVTEGAGLYVKKWIKFLKVTKGTNDEHKIRNDQVNQRAKDCLDVLNHLEKINEGTFKGIEDAVDLSVFKGRLDFEKCSIMGHSFGGATTMTVLAQECRYTVAVSMDTWTFPLSEATYENLKDKPILFINSETYHSRANIENIIRLKDSSSAVERQLVTIRGTVHQFPTDFGLLLRFQWLSKTFLLRGPESPWVVSDLNNKLIRGFVGKHLCLKFAKEITQLLQENEKLLLSGTNVVLDESAATDAD